MQPAYMPIAQIFGAQTRHTVPLFQRPYVWSREEQWEPLWDDVLGLLERLDRRSGDESVASHFLGTIVLEQAPNPTGSLPRREVIDGQQRLTTLQILLKAAEHALAGVVDDTLADDIAAKTAYARRQLAALTANDAYHPHERYKVWPTNEDREPFQKVLDSDAASGPPDDTRMAQAYRFFREAAETYLRSNGERGDIAVRAERLAAALRDYMRLIVLDLDPSDEPQAIFETLNAHGTPLLPADLIKNWLLWEASRQNLDLTPLYEQFWRRFDRDHVYWRARTGTGHAARARVDAFLQSWLTKQTGEAVSPKHLYDRFLRYAAGLATSAPGVGIDITALMSEIAADAERYVFIDKAEGKDRFATFLRRLKPLDVTVLDPVLLALMERDGNGGEDLRSAAVAIESYLVRRMICGYQTRGYGALTLRLLKAIRGVERGQPVATAVATELAAAVSGADSWPSDLEFRDHWRRRNFYNGLRRSRTLMVLQALEQDYQAASIKSEPILTFDLDALQIEHVMPVAWEKHWPVAHEALRDQRSVAVNGIGNLTLISERLNPSLSNGPWHGTPGQGKREGLHKHSKLELNRRLLEAHQDWTDEAIAARADELFESARKIWPAFEAFIG